MAFSPDTGRRTRVTIREVALHADVSQMTVSRVLNKRDSVRPDTRDRVEAAIQELGYRPNLAARSLAGGASCSIGVIYHNASDSYLGEVLRGALTGSHAQGHQLFVESLPDADKDHSLHELSERLTRIGFDGVILVPPLSESEKVLDLLASIGVPCVLIAPASAARPERSVAIDDAAAAQAMTQHIIAQGHTRIAFIRGPAGQVSADSRWEGFEAAMAEAGLPVRKGWTAEGDYTYRSGMLAAEKILTAGKTRPTVIFASNDDMAAGAITTAYRLGLPVPDNLSVVGYDDTRVATSIWPQLTTVRQPIADMAARAVAMLADAVQGTAQESEPPARVVLDFEIIQRESLCRI
ncbi:LacI family DNA-binding transcriptional regulator [Hyphomonas sp.]|uniref:LacI family DNA-binding transcriptional regulator n=1 Tax=Hyphomonas sp. TaxID=87 RepID=UPI00391DF22F